MINDAIVKIFFHQAVDFICVCVCDSPDQEVLVTETVTFQMKFERSMAVYFILFFNLVKITQLQFD